MDLGARLGEQNIEGIVSEVEALYRSNPRNGESNSRNLCRNAHAKGVRCYTGVDKYTARLDFVERKLVGHVCGLARSVHCCNT